MSEYTMGQWMTVKAKAEKTKTSRRPGERYPQDTTWNRVPLDSPVQAMYIGKRTVREGVTRIARETGDYGTVLGEYQEYIPTRSLQVYAFVRNEKENPFFVFPEDAELTGGE